MYERNASALQSIEANSRSNEQEGVNLAKSNSSSGRKKQWQTSSKKDSSTCDYCGNHHRPKQCPAFGHSCARCSKKNHFEIVCRSGENARLSTDEASNCDNEDDDTFVLGPEGNRPKRKFFVSLDVRGKATLRAQVDTGATSSCMSQETFRHLRSLGGVGELFSKQTPCVRTFDNSSVQAIGRCVVSCRHGGRAFRLPLMLFDANVETLLSGRAAEDMRIIQFAGTVERIHLATGEHQSGSNYEGILNEYADIFEGLGEFPQPVKIMIDPSATPRQLVPRRTSISTREALIKKVKQLEKNGIIQRVNYPTPWISNLVQVLKTGGSIRITLDPSFLNKAIVRPRPLMPTLEEHLPLLARARVFTTVDAKDGFYQMKLDPESADLTTFWTPIGRYRYLRTPQGISSASEEYQRRQIEAYEGLRGVLVVADDALLFGVGDTDAEARADHDRNLKALFDRVRKLGIRLNKRKLQLGQESVSYMGHVISR